MELVTFASFGGRPTATRAGKVMRDPPPAAAFTAPAPTPAASSNTTLRRSIAATLPLITPSVDCALDGRVGWAVASLLRQRRGTSGLHRAGWLSTATRGDPRDSATENRP